MRISVYGSAGGDLADETRERAREIGREIARNGHVLLTGACPGLPYEAVLGAAEIGAKIGGCEIIGFSPGFNLKEHRNTFKFPTEHFTRFVYLPKNFPYPEIKEARLKARNITSVAESDACIIIGGRIGTMNEFTIAYDLGKIIGILKGSDGFADEAKSLVTKLGKKTTGQLIETYSQRGLIREIEQIYCRI